MSDVVLTVVDGGTEETGGECQEETCCQAEEPCVPSPEQLEGLTLEGDFVEGIDEAAQLTEADYEMTAMHTAQAMQQIVQTGNKLVAILVHPDAKAGFEAAWQALPDPPLPMQWKERLPIVEDPTIPGVRILTQRDLEKNFLLQHYGPRSGGGNGLIETLQKWCEENQCPVFCADVNFLRTKFLLDLTARVFKEIHIPTGADLIRR